MFQRPFSDGDPYWLHRSISTRTVCIESFTVSFVSQTSRTRYAFTEISLVSNRSKLLVAFFSFLIIVELVIYIFCYVEATRSKLFIELASHTPVSFEIALASVQLATEIALSGSLLFLLCKSRTAMRSSDPIIKRIITCFVSTGFIIIFYGVALLVSLLVASKTFLTVALDINSSKSGCCVSSPSFRTTLTNH